MFKSNEYVTKRDMSLELLKERLQYSGGNQEQRMISDKLRTLRKALLYSYQAATATLYDGREFRCLINPDKNKPAYDNKVISIPFRDICLNAPRAGKTSQGMVDIGMKPGDVFTWKETDTHWLVYLRYLEEDAYFRSEIRRCDQQVTVNDTDYWVYIRGPVETSIEWNQQSKYVWNDLNYSLVMYITADENTNDYFKRFQKIKVNDPRYNEEKNWQITGVDPYYGDGIIQVFLKEWYENSIADAVAAQQNTNTSPIVPVDETAAFIDGPTEVKQYSKAYYQIKNAQGGKWLILWKQQQIDLQCSLDILPLDVSLGEMNNFTLIYRRENQEDITLDISIVSI